MKETFLSKAKEIWNNDFAATEAVQAIMWKRKTADREEIITMAYRDYAPDGFYIDGISVDIVFSQVENVLKPLYKKFRIKQTYGDTTIHRTGQIPGIDYKKFETQIKDDTSFEYVAGEVRRAIEQGALPFFEAYAVLEAVNEQINAMDWDNVNDFVSGIVFLKTLVIKKLINAHDYREFREKANAFYMNEAPKYPQFFKDHDKVFIELMALWEAK